VRLSTTLLPSFSTSSASPCVHGSSFAIASSATISLRWTRTKRAGSRVGIAKRRAGLDVDEAKWLLIARREQVHVPLGFGSFLEYLERTLGYRPRSAIERLRVAEELEQLPATRELLASRPRAHGDADASDDIFAAAKSALRNSGCPAAIANAAVERAGAHVGAAPTSRR